MSISLRKNIVNKEPLIFYINNFLNDEECSHLRFLARDKLRPSLIGKGVRNVIRTGSSCFLKKQNSEILVMIDKKITSLFPNEELGMIESFNIINYKLHQTYAYHTDAYNVDD